MPGPGDYSHKPLIDGTGNTYYSTFKSSTSKSIGIKLRKPINKYPSNFFF